MNQYDNANGSTPETDHNLTEESSALLTIEERVPQPEDFLTATAALHAEREDRLVAQEQALRLREQEVEVRSKSLSVRETILRSETDRLLQKEVAVAALEMEKRSLEERERLCAARLEELNGKAVVLGNREAALRDAELSRDQGYQEERRTLDRELQEKRRAAETDVAELRQKRFAELEKDLATERSQRLDALGKELSQARSHCHRELEEARRDHDANCQAENAKIKAETEKLAEERARLSSHADGLEVEKMKLQSRQGRLSAQEAGIEEEVTRRTAERCRSFETEELMYREECDRLRASLRSTSELLSLYDELKRKLGNKEPEVVLRDLSGKEEELKKLRQELLSRPTQEVQQRLDRLSTEKEHLTSACERLTEENLQLKGRFQEQSVLEMQIQELNSRNKSLTRQFEAVEADNDRLGSELKRIQACYQREGDRSERIGQIEMPYFEKHHERSTVRGDVTQEIAWLKGIDAACLEYGLRFPKRILWAYHTALKTAEWSPLTVLAGVSGTGKSELPKLYAHFGGIKFLNLSVQPNWDSQESMLGFFNSIDNKFDAQPVLRFLAQSQKPRSEEYPGLMEAMCLVLLDEMNLAHVELYFAEFLSKLESRRGRKGTEEMPNLEVKLGAGIRPYELPLGRNVLWTGTMNQDETTKTLSDKVLDRGIIINFPRPTVLERRSQLKPLGTASPLLSRSTWESWWNRESKFTDREILPYKGFIEDTNKALAKVGRALGHRVWQSIEYYMANYPDVMLAQKNGTDLEQAMKTAFEDQLVQKVMPKLRGIETRGRGKNDCLDRIKAQLLESGYDSLLVDFESACEFGYGQFMWHSAHYLEDADGSAQNYVQEIAPAVASPSEQLVQERKGDSAAGGGAASAPVEVEVVDYSSMTPKQQRMFKEHAAKKGK